MGPGKIETCGFQVTIPNKRSGFVVISEYQREIRYSRVDFDALQERGAEVKIARVALKMPGWRAIASVAQRDFNKRFNALKLPAIGRWHAGENLVDRLLGRELCVLAWAAETANTEQLPIICSKWEALIPEERWWFFLKIVDESGLSADTNRGWRKALFYALSDERGW